MPTNAQYALISNTPFVYMTHLGSLIIPDGTTAHMKSNMHIAHTEEVRLFCEVTGVKQTLVQQIFPQLRRFISQISEIAR